MDGYGNFAWLNQLILRCQDFLPLRSELRLGMRPLNEKYLLPCRCGRKVAIEPRQAGESVVCTCGIALQVPTMLEIKGLEPAPMADSETFSSTARAAWGWRQRLKLIGVVLLLSASVAAGLLYVRRPVAITDVMPPEVLQRSAKNLTPLQTWIEWQSAKRGVDRRINKSYMKDVLRYRIWLSVSAITALAGIAMIVAGSTAAVKPNTS